MRSLTITLSLMCLLGASLSACLEQDTESSFGPSKLEKLVMNLDSKYIRSFEKDDFSLHYRARPPGTVIIKVQYNEKTNKQLMYKVVSAAKEQVVGMGADLYSLRGIRVVTEYEEYEPGQMDIRAK